MTGVEGGRYRQPVTEQHSTSKQQPEATTDCAHGLDPTDLLRAMLAISPEDAAAVREDAAEAMKPGKSAQGDEGRPRAVREDERPEK